MIVNFFHHNISFCDIFSQFHKNFMVNPLFLLNTYISFKESLADPSALRILQTNSVTLELDHRTENGEGTIRASREV